MNDVFESKIELLYKSFIKILKDDDVNTVGDVKQISYYCGDRIFRKSLRQNTDFPIIIIDIQEFQAAQTLPTSNYQVDFDIFINSDFAYAWTVLDNISSRINFLFNKKHLNLNNAFPLNKLRCRMLKKESAYSYDDQLNKLLAKQITFSVILDDEFLF